MSDPAPALRRYGGELAGAAAVVAAGLLVFGGSLGVGYFADDFTLLGAVQEGVDWLGPFPAGTEGYFRPLVLATLLTGDTPLLHHAVNLALHLVNALLVLGIVRALGCAGLEATALALVFLVHPLVVPDVYWISGRTDTLCALLYLAGVRAFVGFLRRGSRPLLAAAGGAVLLAPLAKEVGLTLPAALALLWLAGRRGLLGGVRADRERLAAAGRFLVAAGLAAGALGAFLALRFWAGGGIPWADGSAGAVGVLLVAVNGIFLRIEEYDLRRWALIFPWLKWTAAAAAALAAALAVLALRSGGRRGLERLAVSAALPLVPLLPLVALGWARERHLYLPLALAVVALAGALPGGRGRRWVARGALVLVPLLAWRSVAAGGVWQANDRYLETSCASFRAAVGGAPRTAPIVLPTVPFGRGGVPLYSNDAAEALHHCLHGTFGRMDRLHVGSAAALRSARTGPAEGVAVRRPGPRTIELGVPAGIGYFRLIRRPGDGFAAVEVTQKDRAGDPIRLRLRLEPEAGVVLVLDRDGFRRLRTLTGSGRGQGPDQPVLRQLGHEPLEVPAQALLGDVVLRQQHLEGGAEAVAPGELGPHPGAHLVETEVGARLDVEQDGLAVEGTEDDALGDREPRVPVHGQDPGSGRAAKRSFGSPVSARGRPSCSTQAWARRGTGPSGAASPRRTPIRRAQGTPRRASSAWSTSDRVRQRTG